MKRLIHFFIPKKKDPEAEDSVAVRRHKNFNSILGSVEQIYDESVWRFNKQCRRMGWKGRTSALMRTYKPANGGTPVAKAELRSIGQRELAHARADMRNTYEVFKQDLEYDEAVLCEKEEAAHDETKSLPPSDGFGGMRLGHTAQAIIQRQQLRERNNKLTAMMTQAEKNSGFKPSLPQLWNNRYIYWAVMAALFGGEISINFEAFQSIGELPAGLNIVLVVGISVILSFTAAAAAYKLQLKNYGWCALWFISGLSITAFVIMLRSRSEAADPILTLMILPFYLFAFLLSHLKASDGGWHKMNKEKQKNAKKIDGLSHTIETDLRYDRSRIEARKKDLEMVLLQIDESIAAHEEALEKEFQWGCRNFNSKYTMMASFLFRKSSLYDFGTDPPLQDKPYQSDHAGANGQSKSRPSWMRPSKALPSLIGLILCVVMTSCTPHEEAAVTIIIDQTHQHEGVQPEHLSRYVFEDVVHLDENPGTQVSVSVSSIGDVSFQPQRDTVLEKGKSWVAETEKKREKAVAEFQSRVAGYITAMLPDRGGDHHTFSFVHQNVAFQLNALAETGGEGRKCALILSDMLMHTKDVSFYTSPALLDDPDKLKSRLEALTPFEDYSGLEIVIVHQPTPSDDALFSKAVRFWTWLYESQGAKVSIRASVI